MRKTRDQRWFDKAVAAKVGTIPMVIRLDLRRKLSVGARVKFQEEWHGKYETGIVTNLDPLRIARH